MTKEKIKYMVLEFMQRQDTAVKMSTIKRHVLTNIGTVEWCMNFVEMNEHIHEAVWELVSEHQLCCFSGDSGKFALYEITG